MQLSRFFSRMRLDDRAPKKACEALCGALERGLDLAAQGVWRPWLVLAALVALQCGFMLDARDLWFSDEVRYANVLENMVERGHWLVLYLNGEFYPDKPPVYFWLLSGLSAVAGHTDPALFMLGAAVSGLFLLWATHAYARRVMGLSDRDSLAAALVLGSVFYVAGVMHYSRMDLLFATLITLSHMQLYRAVRARGPSVDGRSLVFGMLLAALAALCKGPLGLAFPLLTLVVFCAWTGRLGKLASRAIPAGLAALVLPLAAWALGCWLVEGQAYLDNIVGKQIIERATEASHHRQAWHHYILTFPLAFLPWTLVLVALPWRRITSRCFWSRAEPCAAWRSDEGLVHAWCVVAPGFLLLSAVSIKIVIYLLPLFPALAGLTARALSRLSPRQSMRLYVWLAALLALAGLAAVLGNLFHAWPIRIHGLWLVGLPAAGFAWVLYRWAPRERPLGCLVLFVLFLTLWLQPVGLVTAPSLDPVMSPKAQAEVLGGLAEAGYAPMAYKVYSGTYTYYAGRDIREFRSRSQLEAALAAEDKAVVAMRRKHWDRWQNRPEGLVVAHEQWIVDRPFVLVVKGGDRVIPTP